MGRSGATDRSTRGDPDRRFGISDALMAAAFRQASAAPLCELTDSVYGEVMSAIAPSRAGSRPITSARTKWLW